jgi:hypothetical protein
MEKDGFPPVSHSSQYRLAYKPHYRVVLARWSPLTDGADIDSGNSWTGDPTSRQDHPRHNP